MAIVTDADFTLRSIAVSAFGPSLLFGVAEGAVLPVIVLSAMARGGDAATASLIAAMLGIGSILSNIPAGVLATRYGERRALMLAAGISILGLALCILPLGLLTLALGVLLLGVASSVYSLARQSYLTEAVPVHMRARALSTLGGSIRIGVFVGPFISAGAMRLWGISAAYVVAIVAVAVAGAIAYRLPDLDLEHLRGGSVPKATTLGLLKSHRHLFITLGASILLLSAIRQTRQVVVPLWATHIGLTPTQSSIIYGIAGAIDAAMFYPAGKAMDQYGRRWVAVCSTALMGVSFVLMPLSHGFVTLMLVSLVMGLGNGVGSGIVMTLGADTSPAIGRPTFLGIWRELADTGTGIGPIILSAVTAVSELALGIVVSGFVGFAAAAALWAWIPRPDRRTSRIEPGVSRDAVRPRSSES